MTEVKSVFEFGIKKPKYHPTTVNFKEANLRNMFRSLWVNKWRYVSRLYNHQVNSPLKKLGKLSPEDLKMVTDLARPGPMLFNQNQEKKTDGK